MQLHNLLRRMARRHWQAAAARLRAEVDWDERSPETHDNEFSDMQEAVKSLYEPEGEVMEAAAQAQAYAGLQSDKLAEMLIAKLAETEDIYGAMNVQDSSPIFVDAGLLRALRIARVVAPLDNDNPILKITDHMHEYLTRRIQTLHETPQSRERDQELYDLHQLITPYESMRWSVPKMFRSRTAA